MIIGIQNDPHYGFNQSTSIIYEKMLKRSSNELNKLDLLIFSGDLGTHSYKESIRFMKMVRRYVSVDIGFVLGNHD